MSNNFLLSQSPNEPKLFIDGLDISKEIRNDTNIETECDKICDKILKNKRRINITGHKKIKVDETDKTCSICLDNFQEGLYKRKLKCNHEFHKKCIDNWTYSNQWCPYCRSLFI